MEQEEREKHCEFNASLLNKANHGFHNRPRRSSSCLNLRLCEKNSCDPCRNYYSILLERPNKKRGKGLRCQCEQPWDPKFKNQAKFGSVKVDKFHAATNNIYGMNQKLCSSSSSENSEEEMEDLFTPPAISPPDIFSTVTVTPDVAPVTTEADSLVVEENQQPTSLLEIESLLRQVKELLNQNSLDINYTITERNKEPPITLQQRNSSPPIETIPTNPANNNQPYILQKKETY